MLGILLLTFGSAVTAEEVPHYLASVRAGRDVPGELTAEFQRRYERIGRSPLIDISLAQAAALQGLLDRQHGAGAFRIAVGMLHSSPRVDSAVRELVDSDVSKILAIVLAPQYSPLILGGYERAMETARAAYPGVDITIAGAWHTLPEWIETLASAVNEALAQLPKSLRDTVPIVFTAHSLPRAVVDRDPGYIDQLRDTATAVASQLGLDDKRWSFAYQSAGHTPEEWLKPDVKDLLPGLAASGNEDVLIVPLQFVADHLEILYDIDVAAREEAERAGMRLHRITLPNTAPAFIRALAAVTDRSLAGRRVTEIAT